MTYQKSKALLADLDRAEKYLTRATERRLKAYHHEDLAHALQMLRNVSASIKRQNQEGV